MPKPLDLLSHTNKNIDKAFIKIGFYLILFGLILPTNWEQYIGAFSTPITWAANFIPFIQKSASASPISKLVIGFFGTAFLFLPLFYSIIIFNDSIELRFKNSLKKTNSKRKFIALIYFAIAPALLLVLYLIFIGPSEINPNITPTKGQAILYLMISYRITLALFGCLLILGICGILWILTIIFAGPFFYYIKGVK